MNQVGLNELKIFLTIEIWFRVNIFNMQIPPFTLDRQFQDIGSEIESEVSKVLKKGPVYWRTRNCHCLNCTFNFFT